MKKNIIIFIITAVSLLAATSCDFKNVDSEYFDQSPYFSYDQSKEDSYLTIAKTKSLYSEVSGNGHENGFVATVRTFDHKDADATPLIEFPEADNYADCRISQIKLVNLGFSDHFHYGWYTYEITIDTSVVTDTGGCLVWIKNARSKETLSIINYMYSIDKK